MRGKLGKHEKSVRVARSKIIFIFLKANSNLDLPYYELYCLIQSLVFALLSLQFTTVNIFYNFSCNKCPYSLCTRRNVHSLPMEHSCRVCPDMYLFKKIQIINNKLFQKRFNKQSIIFRKWTAWLACGSSAGRDHCVVHCYCRKILHSRSAYIHLYKWGPANC